MTTDTARPAPAPKPSVNNRRPMPEVDLPTPPVSIADERAEPSQVETQPTSRKRDVTFIVHALLDGFPVDVQFCGSAELLLGTIARLRELGAMPPTAAALSAAALDAARSAPVCPYHGPMKPSPKVPGTFFCSHRMGDGSYCKERG